MRERTPQRITCVSSHGEGAFYFSQSNTEEQNTQSFTETLSQPISQNVTANVSWKASVTSVCRRRSVDSKRWWKGSVKSVRSVRERNTLCERERYSLWEKKISSVRKKYYPPCEKGLPKKLWCKEIKSPKAYLIIKAPLPQFKNMLFSMREHAL